MFTGYGVTVLTDNVAKRMADGLDNRGIWDAIDSAGPAVGIQTSTAEVERYLEALNDFPSELTA